MADAFTVNYNLVKPEEGASLNTWGGKLNVNMDTLDAAIQSLQDQIDSAFNPLTGQIAAFARTAAPEGWLIADGSAVSRTTYARLFDVIGTDYGEGNGATTFNLPDLRGDFIRALDLGRGVDPDSSRALGSVQDSQNLEHNHTASSGNAGAHNHTASTASAGSHRHTGTTDSSGNHRHTGATGASGNHSHTGSTNSAGSHRHSGSIGSAGAHSHTLDVADGDSGGLIGSVDGGNNNRRAYRSGYIGSAGAHTHTLSINGNGAHSHSLSINTNGSHTHSFTTGFDGDHTHGFTTNSNGAHTHSVTVQNAGAHSHSVTVNNAGGSEARPRNSAWLVCIKF